MNQVNTFLAYSATKANKWLNSSTLIYRHHKSTFSAIYTAKPYLITASLLKILKVLFLQFYSKRFRANALY